MIFGLWKLMETYLFLNWIWLLFWKLGLYQSLSRPFELNCLNFIFPTAVWHQYDDTIFCPPGWIQSIRNLVPFLRSTGPLEGRIIATKAMLPRWEGFNEHEVDTNMTAWEAVGVVNDLAYCMTQSKVEDYGIYTGNVPSGYNFRRVCNH